MYPNWVRFGLLYTIKLFDRFYIAVILRQKVINKISFKNNFILLHFSEILRIIRKV